MTSTVVEDIKDFFTISSRADNDATNRRRERSIRVLNDPTHPFFSDTTYGEMWCSLRDGLHGFIRETLSIRNLPAVYKRFHLEPRGGLSNHFDILIIIYTQENTVLTVIDFEFKFNSMPQFTNLFDKDSYITPTLAEFWYDNGWVDRMCEPYTGLLTYEKPSRDEYLKGANKMMTKTFPPSFFKQFYNFDHSDDINLSKTLYARRVDATHQGIRAYLQTYGPSFNITKLCNKLEQDQVNKIYGIWNPVRKSFKYL